MENEEIEVAKRKVEEFISKVVIENKSNGTKEVRIPKDQVGVLYPLALIVMDMYEKIDLYEREKEK